MCVGRVGHHAGHHDCRGDTCRCTRTDRGKQVGFRNGEQQMGFRCYSGQIAFGEYLAFVALPIYPWGLPLSTQSFSEAQ